MNISEEGEIKRVSFCDWTMPWSVLLYEMAEWFEKHPEQNGFGSNATVYTWNDESMGGTIFFKEE